MTHEEIFQYSVEERQPVTPTVSFGVVGLAHGHIYGMCSGLIKAGAQIKYVYDADPALLEKFTANYPEIIVCASEDEVLEKDDIQLIVSADIPAHRADVGIRAMKNGKDFFVDKAPMTTLEQVEDVRKVCNETGKKYIIFYGESLCDASAIYARDLIRRGVIGQVLHVDGVGPHRHNPPSRAPWFYQREHFGGILIDIVPHALQRFATWRHIWEAPLDGGYQQTRALMCMVSGGLLGIGPGRGWMKNVFAADSDVVVATVSEEWGLIMAVFLLLAVAGLALFAVRSASVGRSSFYTIGSCTAAAIMLVQVILNVLGTVDILPLTGVTFPFLSNGGSSMICAWGLLAFVKAADTRQNASFAVRLHKNGVIEDE